MPNYILLERIELNASAASITFANIPQTGYTDLKIVVSARTTNAATSDTVLINFNGLTTNQSSRRIQGDGSVASSSTATQFPFVVDGNTSTASTFGNAEIYICNYNSTSTYKSFSIDSVRENNSATADAGYNQLWASLWSSNSAITSIQIACQGASSFVQYSTFSLYGLAAVGTTPVIAPKATGGNITTDGTYWIHTFNTSGTFTPQTSLSCDYLVVAGGGAGGSGGGGGGAGGFRTATSQALTATGYTVTVGAGGAGSAGAGATGTSSVFNSTTSAGGGGGGVYATSGLAGGSGGGGGRDGNSAAFGGAASPAGQGSAGGNGGTGNFYFGGGGGGGASAAGGVGIGGSAVNERGGAGGNGSANSYSGSSVTYAGGGGGGVQGNSNAALGGTGGGGNGGAPSAGVAGTTNLGGGGGGSGSGNGAAGGSGIVIIRYLAA
jgi:hypothetical protein